FRESISRRLLFPLATPYPSYISSGILAGLILTESSSIKIPSAIEGEYDEYKSNKYQGNQGVQPSMMYKDFE
ncbi:MAG: hypothetical protein OEV78_13080, partial [Spirochaetia bacterium]|nr:hypothetical protein [Spirochaetia bacterium]